MAVANFAASLAFVWRPGFDDPADGYHVTPGDAGGGTKGGVIEATWRAVLPSGGDLASATNEQLAAVLRSEFWGTACDNLPSGLDLVLFNGRMMSGGYPKLFQQCLGLTGDDVDGRIGPFTLAVARQAEPATLINAAFGAHWAYLCGLSGWGEFGGGWSTRLKAARIAATAMVSVVPMS